MDFNRNESQNTPSRQFKGKSVGFGIVVILAGLLLMARNTGFLDDYSSNIIFSWEMLLIAIGLINIFSRHSIWSGLILIAIGGFFLLQNHFGLPVSLWHIFWPAIVILIGLSLIFGASRMRHHQIFTATSGDDDFIEDLAIFGGGERKVASQAFRGGKLLAVFGGSKIDLSHAALAPGTNLIEIVAAFGGSSLLVPSDWNVKVEVFNIFGGFADKRMISQVDQSKTLVIKGVTIFGGGEIRSF